MSYYHIRAARNFVVALRRFEQEEETLATRKASLTSDAVLATHERNCEDAAFDLRTATRALIE